MISFSGLFWFAFSLSVEPINILEHNTADLMESIVAFINVVNKLTACQLEPTQILLNHPPIVRPISMKPRCPVKHQSIELRDIRLNVKHDMPFHIFPSISKAFQHGKMICNFWNPPLMVIYMICRTEQKRKPAIRARSFREDVA
jgi:hypothetical protein